MWGSRRFATKDDSRNIWWVALLTFGEGWHNNHHAHPTSARHGLAWYEFDVTWLELKVLRALGLVWDVDVAKVARADAGDRRLAGSAVSGSQPASIASILGGMTVRRAPEVDRLLHRPRRLPGRAARSRSTSAGSSSAGAQAGLLVARPPRLSRSSSPASSSTRSSWCARSGATSSTSVHQRRHARAEDAGRVDAAVPADAADRASRRGKRQEFYRIMLEDSDRLLSTIEQVLRAGQLRRAAPPQRAARRVDLGAIVAECVALARTRYHLPPEALTYRERRRAARRRVLGDEDDLKAVVSNLVDNAIKYSGADVQVASSSSRPTRQRLALRVATTASASRRPSASGSSSASTAFPARRDAGQGHAASGCSSSARSSRATAARCSPRARGRASGSTFTVHLPVVAARNEPHPHRRRRATPRRRPALQPRGRAARRRRRRQRRGRARSGCIGRAAAATISSSST